MRFTRTGILFITMVVAVCAAAQSVVQRQTFCAVVAARFHAGPPDNRGHTAQLYPEG
jgi:hypothetical protein